MEEEEARERRIAELQRLAKKDAARDEAMIAGRDPDEEEKKEEE